MSKILVTGGSGQLGRELRLKAQIFHDHTFVFTDRSELNIADAFQVRHVMERERPSCVINCAAYTAVDRAESDADAVMSINHSGAELCANEAHRIDAGFIHVSTDFVFDGKKSTPYFEDDMTSPLGVYGLSKREGERAVLDAHPDACIIRTSWLYSAYGTNFVKTMLRLGRERSEIGVIADQVGSPTWAADLADVLLQAVSADLSGIFHYSNEGVASWYDFAIAIMELSGLSCDVRPLETHEYPTPAQRPAYSIMNKRKIRSALNISIPYWRVSLQKCIERLKQEDL